LKEKTHTLNTQTLIDFSSAKENGTASKVVARSAANATAAQKSEIFLR